MKRLSERQSVFSHTGMLTALLGKEPAEVTVESAEKAILDIKRKGGLHSFNGSHSASG